MGPRRFIGLTLAAWVTTWGLAAQARAAPPEPEAGASTAEAVWDSSAGAASPRSAVVRSLLIPGWGQWHNGRRLKATLIFGASCALGAATAYENRQLRNASTEGNRTTYRHGRNTLAIWLIGTVLYGLADSYVDAHLSGFDEEMQGGALSVGLGPTAPALTYSTRW